MVGRRRLVRACIGVGVAVVVLAAVAVTVRRDDPGPDTTVVADGALEPTTTARPLPVLETSPTSAPSETAPTTTAPRFTSTTAARTSTTSAPTTTTIPARTLPPITGDAYSFWDGQGRLVETAVDGGVTRVLVDLHAPCHCSAVSWAPDGRRFVYTDHNAGTGQQLQTFLYVGDVDTGVVTKGPRALRASWSPMRDVIAFDGPEGRISVMAPDGSDVRTVATYSAATPSFSWSPDGAWIAFHDWPEGGWGEVVSVVRADGTEKHPLLREPDVGIAGSWSPDSHQLAYTGTKRKDAQHTDETLWGLYVVSTEDPTPHALCLCNAQPPTWSPNGKTIADRINSSNGPASEVRLFSVADGTARTLAAQNVHAVRWSPTGRYLAAVWPNQAILFNADGDVLRTVAVSTDDARTFSFSPIR